MKSIIIKLIVVAFIIMLQSQYSFSADMERLGRWLSTENEILGADEFGLETVTTFYFEHGSITKWKQGNRVVTIVGYDCDGDDGWTKKSIHFNDNEVDNILVYEINNYNSPKFRINQKIMKDNFDNLFDNHDIFENGKSYVLLFYDKSGHLVKSQKIHISK